MNFFENIIDHFSKMNGLEGAGSDYPVMLCIYLGIFLLSFIANIVLYASDHGNRVVWLADQHKVIKSRFNYMAMLACTFTGVYLVGSFPSELQNTFGTWNADLFYTLGQTTIMITAGIYSLATFKKRSSVILNSLSIIIGLSTSIPMAATTILLPLNIDSDIIRLSAIIATIVTFVFLAALSVKYDLLVKYSRINIYLFIITTIALFTTINTFSNADVDTSKILPFQGMINGEPWQELLTNPYWWYFEATVVSWSIFCGRFIAYCSNGYSIKEIIRYGTISLIILTAIWHLVSAATGYTLSFSRGWVIYGLTALTMLAFAVTSLDSASKTLLNDITRISKSHNLKYKPSFFLKCIMGGIGVINIIILYTGSSRLFTILFCLIFVPFLAKAIVYCIKFAFGKVDFAKSGTITKEEYIEICGEEPDESDYRRII
ncbi:BCCT family transporter [Prevotella brevis]|nr:BCCT family transporter [Xylanibacter brevis]